VHSSTLVTAGVFLLYRFYPYLRSCKYFSECLLLVATITTLIAGISAIIECDIKKVVALSTLSQLGVIIVSLRIKAPYFAFFHLITHALFKALLFLCAGSVIHYHYHSQDLRFISNWRPQMPSLIMPLIIANIALCGIPFIAGFYSKDQILEFIIFNQINFRFITLFILGTLLTSIYTLRFLSRTILAENLSLPINISTDTNKKTTYATIILSTGAVIRGSVLN
jgi:NADH-ubiquinone oxidoreductase chain 5